MPVIRSVSLSIEEDEFCHKQGYSLTRVLRQAIEERKNDPTEATEFDFSKRELKRKIEKQQKIMGIYADFIFIKGMEEEFNVFMEKRA